MKTSSPRLLAAQGAVMRVPQTLADVIEIAGTDYGLLPSRRRDIVSAVRRLCNWRHVDPAVVPASHRAVRDQFGRLHWQEVGISRKRFQNARADVQVALDRYVTIEAAPRGRGFGPEWAELWTRLPEGEGRYRLSRPIGFCDRRGIAPGEVDDATIVAFKDWLENATLIGHPDQIVMATVSAWNKAVDDVNGWPTRRLTLPNGYTPYTMKWDELPDAFRLDTEAWFARNMNPDPLDDDAPLRPWRPGTLKTRRFNIRQLVSALRSTGHDVSTLRGLADLVEVDTAKEALRFFLNRNGGKTSSQIAGLASLLCAIAEHWIEVDPDHLKKLRRLKSQLAHSQNGLTAKNRDRLRQFADRSNLIAFLSLPQDTMERLKKKNVLTVLDALDMQVAVATEVLLMAPFRRHNLVAIERDKHIRIVGRGRDRKTFIAFPEQEVKNRINLDYPIPRETDDVIEFYVERCLPLLRQHGGMFLFPGDRPGTHKHEDAFSRQFTRTVCRLTGLTVNLHLMRHLGALLYLDRKPGAYEVVRRVLGHRRLSTTLNNYTGAETNAAIKHFDAVILGIRNEFRGERGVDD